MANRPDWIQPGAQATLIWADSRQEVPDGTHLYEIAGPVLQHPPTSPFFLIAPLSQSDFAGQLYRDKVTVEDLRRFLADCLIALGGVGDDLGTLIAVREAALLPLLEEWADDEGGALLSYREEIGAFLHDNLPLNVTTGAHQGLQQSPEYFGSAWICEGCGEPEDAANFLWTRHQGSVIQVRLVIQNIEGTWTCWLHPFRVEKAGRSS
jgi:hypothetical protein